MATDDAMATDEASGLARAVERVGDRWSLLLAAALLEGPRRFNELLEDVPGIAPNILTARLRQLERDGIVVAQPYSERPQRFSYELTAAGAELAGALRLLAGWGAGAAGGEGPRHSICGSALEARWWCPACEALVDEGDGLTYV